jgi:hypothetical protein
VFVMVAVGCDVMTVIVCCVKETLPNTVICVHSIQVERTGPLATAYPAATAGAAAAAVGTVRRTEWAGTGTAAGRFLSAAGAAVAGTEACQELLENILLAKRHI